MQWIMFKNNDDTVLRVT